LGPCVWYEDALITPTEYNNNNQTFRYTQDPVNNIFNVTKLLHPCTDLVQSGNYDIRNIIYMHSPVVIGQALDATKFALFI